MSAAPEPLTRLDISEYRNWRDDEVMMERLLVTALAYHDCRDELTAAQEENARLRAALAQSELPCVYCSLPRDEWAKCASGFPGCARGDDAMGCPALGEAHAAQERVAKQAMHTAAAYHDCRDELARVMSQAKFHSNVAAENMRLRDDLVAANVRIAELEKALEDTLAIADGSEPCVGTKYEFALRRARVVLKKSEE